MAGERVRGTLLAGGRVSCRMWLRALHLHDAEMRQHTQDAFDRHSSTVPWPDQPVLQLHLVFSVLPGAAVYSALQRHGYGSDDAAAAVTEALVSMARPRRRVLRSLAGSMRGRRLFMRAAARSLRVFPEPGWQATWHERSAQRVAFDMTRCFDLEMLRRLDAEAIAPAYCAVDDVLYAGLHPDLQWTRTGTIATGASRCDFCFEHLPAGTAQHSSEWSWDDRLPCAPSVSGLRPSRRSVRRRG